MSLPSLVKIAHVDFVMKRVLPAAVPRWFDQENKEEPVSIGLDQQLARTSTESFIDQQQGLGRFLIVRVVRRELGARKRFTFIRS